MKSVFHVRQTKMQERISGGVRWDPIMSIASDMNRVSDGW